MARIPGYWYGGGRVPLSARAVAALYEFVTRLRMALYTQRLLSATRAGVPVVVVGNITAGGTGKTPLTIALLERLRDAGWNPGVATRG
ncbi:tetraacyldisaccharide 4'-kinase, partial [Cognatilysobacter lacus]